MRGERQPEPPVAAPDHAEKVGNWLAHWREVRGAAYEVAESNAVSNPMRGDLEMALMVADKLAREASFLLSERDALLAERQQDKQRIERMVAVLDDLCDWAQHVSAPDEDRIHLIVEEAAAALAGEEDAAGTKSSEADSAAIPPTVGPSKPKEREEQAAGEEDAENG